MAWWAPRAVSAAEPKFWSAMSRRGSHRVGDRKGQAQTLRRGRWVVTIASVAVQPVMIMLMSPSITSPFLGASLRAARPTMLRTQRRRWQTSSRR